MTKAQEEEMHALAKGLASLTGDSPWPIMRYIAIAKQMDLLCAFCWPSKAAQAEHDRRERKD